jgi:apolipoprotein N-acyltransferase
MDRNGFRAAVYRAGLLLVSVLLLTLAFAPWKQFYLAWVGLAPWLICISRTRSQKSAFFLSWIAGTVFFTANMWWMAAISWPGMIALMVYCGLYWGFAALVIRGAGLLDRNRVPVLAGVFGVAMVWTAFEWLRGIVITGLPWLYLAHTQSPFLPICQIADVTGAYGVTFWVGMVNALVALAWIGRDRLPRILPTATATGIVTLALLLYGIYRVDQTPDFLSAGPTIAVVQANYPQSNSGAKGATISERLKFHVDQTIQAVEQNPGSIDLAVWSETMMWPINHEARGEDAQFDELYQALSQLTSGYHVALLTGGEYYADWQNVVRDGQPQRLPLDRRNTAYFFDQSGVMNDGLGQRYDKIHLVPWGEFIPLKYSVPILYRLFVQLGPKYYSDYELQSGSPDQMTVFTLRAGDHSWRFVTPICFEDIDARLCARMFRPAAGARKRADFLVNITNDGWFMANQNAQQLQAATFRSIENRVWSARSVNTGISGFIDSTGRASNLLEVRQPGTSVERIMIDSRLTFYTRYGDLFALVCVCGSAALALVGCLRRKRDKKS